jgi:hypothetical protein
MAISSPGLQSVKFEAELGWDAAQFLDRLGDFVFLLVFAIEQQVSATARAKIGALDMNLLIGAPRERSPGITRNVALSTQPPSRSMKGAISVPPPAKLSRSGALARMCTGTGVPLWNGLTTPFVILRICEELAEI